MMIIKLHEKFDEIPEDSWVEYHLELKNIIQAHRDGKHIFLPSRSIVDKLINSNLLDDIDKGTIKLIKNKYIDYSSVEEICSKVLVLFDYRIGHQSGGDGKYIYFDIKLMINSDYVSACRLILENSKYDYVVMKLIFDSVSSKKKWPAMNFSVCNGGGSQIGDVLDYQSDVCGPLVCLYDTDKRSKTAPEGDTARNVRRVIDLKKLGERPLFFSKSISVREVENLIPLEIMEILEPSRSMVMKKIAPKWPILSDDEYLLFSYYDTKESIKLSDLKEFHDADDERHIKLLRKRVGDIAEKVSKSLAISLCKKLENSEGDRESYEVRKNFMNSFNKSPFFDFVSDLYKDLLSYAVHDKRRGVF